jgi:polysaccharide export outer membrane protein
VPILSRVKSKSTWCSRAFRQKVSKNKHSIDGEGEVTVAMFWKPSLFRAGLAVLLGLLIAQVPVGGGLVPGAIMPVRAQGLQEYTLVPGDVVDIAVFGQPDLSRSETIRPDGRITLPLVGDIQAAGLTPSQLAERIAAVLKAYVRDPQVSVSVRAFQRAVVHLVGQVVRPGAVEIQRGWTVMDVMAVAGGLTPRAAPRRATLIRRGTGQTINLDLEKLLLRGDRTADVTVEPGDIIMVPVLQNRVLMLGAIRSPGAYDLDEDARFLDAIARAGGPADRAGTNNIGVIREGPDGRPTVITINLNSIVRGDMSGNIPIRNGDVIFVPQGPLVRWQEVLSWLAGLGLIRSLLGI